MPTLDDVLKLLPPGTKFVPTNHAYRAESVGASKRRQDHTRFLPVGKVLITTDYAVQGYGAIAETLNGPVEIKSGPNDTVFLPGPQSEIILKGEGVYTRLLRQASRRIVRLKVPEAFLYATVSGYRSRKGGVNQHGQQWLQGARGRTHCPQGCQAAQAPDHGRADGLPAGCRGDLVPGRGDPRRADEPGVGRSARLAARAVCTTRSPTSWNRPPTSPRSTSSTAWACRSRATTTWTSEDILAAMRVLPSPAVMRIKDWEAAKGDDAREEIVNFNIGYGESPDDRQSGRIGAGGGRGDRRHQAGSRHPDPRGRGRRAGRARRGHHRHG